MAVCVRGIRRGEYERCVVGLEVDFSNFGPIVGGLEKRELLEVVFMEASNGRALDVEQPNKAASGLGSLARLETWFWICDLFSPSTVSATDLEAGTDGEDFTSTDETLEATGTGSGLDWAVGVDEDFTTTFPPTR